MLSGGFAAVCTLGMVYNARACHVCRLSCEKGATLKPPTRRCVATSYTRSTPSAHAAATDAPSGAAASALTVEPVRMCASASAPGTLTIDRSVVLSLPPSCPEPCRSKVVTVEYGVIWVEVYDSCAPGHTDDRLQHQAQLAAVLPGR